MHAVVVGSGPAALATVKALLRYNARVTVLDVGQVLDPERRALVDQLAKLEPDDWPSEIARRVTENATVHSLNIPRKLAFGSDFVYAGDCEIWPMQFEGTQARGTFARGGFSNVWGGAMLPADDCDMDAWPIRRADLADSYRRVLADLPLSASEDALAEAFPLYKDRTRALDLPQQAHGLLHDLEAISTVTRPGPPVLAGQARLAVWTQHEEDERSCRYCGMCLSSCPYGAIYGTDQEIGRLAAEGKIEYVSGACVERLDESSSGVTVHFTETGTDARASRQFDRAYIGAGALHTTRIVLESLGMYDTPVEMLDSLKILLPLMRLKREPIAWPNLNTLASLFLETKVAGLSDHWVHVQISGVNELVLRKLGLETGVRAARIPWWLRPGLERLMVAWCSAHSDHSSRIELRLSTRRRAGRHILEGREIKNPDLQATARQIAGRLARLGLKAKTIFLAPLLRISPAGSSGHYGGTFPMRLAPGGTFYSDIQGRPCGLERVHLVDASVFPSIPGTTMVLPIMANADRIVLTSMKNSAGPRPNSW